MVIEHKVLGGRETFSHDQHQSFRLWKDAMEKATRYGIDCNRVLTIFLAPQGLGAKDPRWITLPFEFVACAARRIAHGALPSVAYSLLAFADFYERCG